MISRMEYVGCVRIASAMRKSVYHELPNVRVVRRKRQMRRARVHHRSSPYIWRNRVERLHAARHLLGECRGCLDFVCIERLPVFAQKVDFYCARPVSVKVEVGPLAGVESSLECIRDHHVFEYVAQEGVSGHVFGRTYSEKIRDKARIGEVYLGCFGDAFAEIVVVRAQREYDVGSAQDGNPAGNRLFTDADVLCEGLFVDELSDSSSKQLDKGLKQVKVSYVLENCANQAWRDGFARFYRKFFYIDEPVAKPTCLFHAKYAKFAKQP